MLDLRHSWKFKDSIDERSGWNVCHEKVRGGKGKTEVIDLDFLVFMQISIDRELSQGVEDVQASSQSEA